MRVKGYKKIYHEKINQRKSRMDKLSNKIYFRANKITRHREGHNIIIKEASTRRHRNPKSVCTKQQGQIMWSKTWEMQKEIDKPTIILRDFKNLLSAIDRISTQKMSKGIEELNNTINQHILIDIYRTFHQQEQNTHSFQVPTEHKPR